MSLEYPEGTETPYPSLCAGVALISVKVSHWWQASSFASAALPRGNWLQQNPTTLFLKHTLSWPRGKGRQAPPTQMGPLPFTREVTLHQFPSVALMAPVHVFLGIHSSTFFTYQLLPMLQVSAKTFLPLASCQRFTSHLTPFLPLVTAFIFIEQHLPFLINVHGAGLIYGIFLKPYTLSYLY